jgi:2-polyprenyl-6-methoxyphenol hydroxylase-like FAD-dependent oxidoreductase
MREFDAIAIGGGLAGTAFALELARQGLRVAIVERTATPTLKVCGDFLSRERKSCSPISVSTCTRWARLTSRGCDS